MSNFEHPDVVLCPGGPMLLRGEHGLEDADGVVHRTVRPVTAVCRCHRSAILPWCERGVLVRLDAP